VSEPALEGPGVAQAADRRVANRKARRREAILLAALAITGAAIEYPLALALKSLSGRELLRTSPFLGITLVLAALIPLVLAINDRLGLPGAPLIAAKLTGEKLHFSLRNLIKVSFGYALLAALAGAGVLALIIVPLLLIKHGAFKIPNPPMLSIPPGRIAIVGALVAVAAAVSEEIQFRMVLYAILGWFAHLLSSDERDHPRRGALWIVTLLQGYLFGLVHLVPLGGMFFHSTWRLMLAGLVMPQMWEGVVFGRLYLRRGLEASIIAHASMDLSLFLLTAIGMLSVHLGSK